MYNLTIESKTSTDVTLSWSAVNMTANSTFRAEVSSGDQNYVIANSNCAPHYTLLNCSCANTFVFQRLLVSRRRAL